ncbi:MAG: c-type cytochrome, partial [Gammaproteobacteria bacterium]|nr:c-type cytochrome [Gammaproteobacteria bacterium]
MRKNIRIKHALLGLLLAGATTLASASDAEQIAKGKSLFMNKKKGNCIACHMINDPDANLPGMQGPPIVAMQARFPDINILRAQIWDATVR